MLFCVCPPGGACSWTPTRPSSCWWTATAWCPSRRPFPRCTSARGTTTASCTWSTPPRRHSGRTKPPPGPRFRTLIRSLAPVLLPHLLAQKQTPDSAGPRLTSFLYRFAQSWFQIIRFFFPDPCLWFISKRSFVFVFPNTPPLAISLETAARLQTRACVRVFSVLFVSIRGPSRRLMRSVFLFFFFFLLVFCSFFIFTILSFRILCERCYYKRIAGALESGTAQLLSSGAFNFILQTWVRFSFLSDPDSSPSFTVIG